MAWSFRGDTGTRQMGFVSAGEVSGDWGRASLVESARGTGRLMSALSYLLVSAAVCVELCFLVEWLNYYI